MTFGINDEGFEQKRLNDILDEAETNLALIQDPESEEFLQPDFESSDPTMQIIKVPLEGLGIGWEALAAVYSQFDPDKATKAALSSLVQLNGIDRNEGVPSAIPIELAGTPGTIIPAGKLISDENQNTIWETAAEYTIGGGGTIAGSANSVDDGAFQAPIGTVETILENVPGWDSVTNTGLSIEGVVEESDANLRIRRENSTMAPASGPAEAIYANLSDLDGVEYARVFVNKTLVVDARGIPAKTVAAVISGGDDNEIAKVLLARTDMSEFFGNTIVVLYDLQGEAYVVRWIRPDLIDVKVEVTIEVVDSNSYPSDGDDQMKQAIVDYSKNGASAVGVCDPEKFDQLGFVPDDDVLRSRLYTPINSIPGHRVTLLRVAKVGDAFGIVDIPIDYDEVANFTNAEITVIQI